MPDPKSRSEPEPFPAPLAWARRFLPEYFSDTPAPFHAALFNVLHDDTKRLVARVAPRGHAKSTCATLAYPLWCICERTRRNIVIITNESSLATQFVRDIRNEIETNERILDQYGDLSCTAIEVEAEKPKRGKRRSRAKWSEGKFTTATGVTVHARGCGASLRGTRIGPHRPDLIICDDIEKDEQVAAPEGRRKLEHWLRRVVMPALSPDGKLLVLGSLIHHDSLLANLRDRSKFPRWDYVVYRALEAEPDADGVLRHKALWPARWPVERLLEERQRLGTRAFEQEYQANPIDDSLRVFPEEWLQRYDEAELKRKKLVTLMAVDPATGKDDGDYFAIWVGSVDLADGTIYTRVLTIERIGIVEQVRRILKACQRWRPVKIGIETVAYQVALKQILEEESRRRKLYLPIVGLMTTQNKRVRIEGASPFFENGLFRLPRELPEEIEAQFLHFPKARHDDAPDVCAMGIELARTYFAGGSIEVTTLADLAEQVSGDDERAAAFWSGGW